jgi:hypothetical protein
VIGASGKLSLSTAPGPVETSARVLHQLVRRDDTRRLYGANRQALGRLGQVLEQLWTVQLAELAEEAERERGE